MGQSISPAEVTEVVKKLLGRTRVGEVDSEYLSPLDGVGLSWMMNLRLCGIQGQGFWTSRQGGVLLFKSGDPRVRRNHSELTQLLRETLLQDT